ncbi:MAG: ferrous iron transport protein A [Ndongobacter sp.]|nr:ferrous iron transport protein A [Ndongobacter sp.]
MKSILNLKPNETGTILHIHGRGPLKRRFSDMGVTKGTVVQVIKVAPLGDPIQINLKGYELTIRKADAKDIEIE